LSRSAMPAPSDRSCPPEPCAQVRILPGAPCLRCQKTPPPAKTLDAGSLCVRSRMPLWAAGCRDLWTIRGQRSWPVAAGQRPQARRPPDRSGGPCRSTDCPTRHQLNGP
jgi:hypothetical protein